MTVGPESPSITTVAAADEGPGAEHQRCRDHLSGGYFPSGGPAVGIGDVHALRPVRRRRDHHRRLMHRRESALHGALFRRRGRTTPRPRPRVVRTRPPAPGKYAWIASYAGNADNEATSGACGDANEASLITKAPASLTTAQTLRPQDSVTVAASVGGTPSGTVTFKLFGPNNPTCDPAGAAAAYTEPPVTLNGGGSAVTNNTTFSMSSGERLAVQVARQLQRRRQPPPDHRVVRFGELHAHDQQRGRGHQLTARPAAWPGGGRAVTTGNAHHHEIATGSGRMS